MHFHEFDPVPPDSAQATVWAALRRAFAGGERGFAFYHYPILRSQGRRPRQPDIALFDPALGLCVIECRGYRAGDGRAVEGEDWRLADREDVESPLAEALDQHLAVEHRYRESRATRGKVELRWCLALPFISREEWRQRGLDQ